jgi:AcrR family transcriptional regulator
VEIRVKNEANVIRAAGTKPDIRDVDRDASGRRKIPKGIRFGGEDWNRIHALIAASALNHLADAGYTAFSIEAVAAASGVNKRTVYRHYATKLDLALTGIRQMPTWAGWTDTTGSPKERLRHAMSFGVHMQRHLVGVMAACLIHADDVPELMDTFRHHVLIPREKAIAAFLSEGKKAGWVRSDVTAWQVLALIMGMDVSVQLGANPLAQPRKWTNLSTDALWQLIAADPSGDGSTVARKTTAQERTARPTRKAANRARKTATKR